MRHPCGLWKDSGWRTLQSGAGCTWMGSVESTCNSRFSGVCDKWYGGMCTP